MMGSEVDLAVESILSKDCSTDMVDVDVSSETPNFVMTELANSFYQQQQHRTPPRPPARSSYSPSSSSVDQQQHSETETEGTPIFGANIVGDADLLNTPKNVKYINETGCSSSAYFQRGVVETSSPLTASVNAAALDPGCCKPVDVEDSDIIHSISQDFLEEAILGVVFDAHRSAKCGLAFLDKFAAENDDKYKIVDEFRSLNNNCTDIFGQALAGGRSAKFVQQVDCFCPECHQSTAACRFAPHLEKCMGMGRNSFRKARTRLAASSAASHSSTSGVGHYSSVKSSKINNNNNNNNNNRRVEKNSWSDAEEGAEDDDDDWLSTRKKGQQRKRLVPKSASKKKVRSSPMKKKQSSSFMVSSESSELLSNQLLGEDSNSNAGILLSDLLDTPPLYGSGGDDKGIRSRNDDSPMFTIGSGRGVQKLPDEDDDADYFDFDVPSPSL